ncbi:unnamed protein product [Clonostachys chloroleuca]|uniref:Uncharacterized protein n=1 Tax=Clonostachys chloroleuca TaxID=1926264 RepID=A0AA35Q3F9_9HYPO|nr:unnamed protein product [Clonostachys chloroleuca]
MDDQSRWKETEEIYSILLTRGEDLKWRASLESRNLQHMYLAKGFSLSFQNIDGIRKSVVVQVLNTLVKDGVNFISCYAFTENVNRKVWIKIALTTQSPCMVYAFQLIAATPGGYEFTTTQIQESYCVLCGEFGEASR